MKPLSTADAPDDPTRYYSAATEHVPGTFIFICDFAKLFFFNSSQTSPENGAPDTTNSYSSINPSSANASPSFTPPVRAACFSFANLCPTGGQ